MRRPKYVPPSAQQNRKQARLAVVYSALAIALLGAVLILYSWLDRPRIDPLGCPDTPLPAITAILVDVTDSYTPVQREFILGQLTQYLEKTQKFEKVYLFVVDTNSLGTLDPVSQRCNPGTGADENPVTGNPRLSQKRWRKLYLDPLQAALTASVARPPESESPIMEWIQAISVRAYKVPLQAGGRKRLIIVSDLLHHTAEYSHYRAQAPSFAAFRKSPVYQRLWTDLSDVHVQVFYLRRPNAMGIQGREHITEFWEPYFRTLGAVLDEVVRVPG